MALTNSQLQALKSHIEGDGTLNAFPNTPDGNFALADVLNGLSNPAFIVWRTQVSSRELIGSMVWTEYIGRSIGERDAWRFMTEQGSVDAGDPNVRQGILDIFSGQGGVGTRSNLIAVVKRTASRAEALLANGAGAQGNPGTLTFEGSVVYQDVEAARNLP
jgi:hypothetical protein